ncbi:MAG: transcription termination/antitermination protein NusA [Clostridiales bacterium]|nr:transcription termination/antitermination protein NusA [Clostridiales bacterium]
MAKKKEPEIEIIDLMDAIRDLAKERGISEDEIFGAIEDGIVAAFKREFGGANKQDITNVSAEIDRETGEIGVYKTVEVVEEVFDDANEISLADAQEMDPDLEIGDMIDLTIEVENLGRLAAGAAKSSISQKLREAESRKIEKEFKDKMGDITTGSVLRKDNAGVYVDIGRAEAMLKRNGQIKNEKYDSGKMLKFLVVGVEEQNGRPSVILSRTAPELVKKLFELEVPELKDGEVEIVSVAREAGSRSKVAVASRNPDVDAKGSFVGPRGQRVQNVMNAINGEKIDIIEFNPEPGVFISEALQPAKAVRVEMEEVEGEDGRIEKKATVVVPDDQFTLAIGRSGQNVRLAAKLTGYKIDIKKESDDIDENSQKVIGQFTAYDEEGNIIEDN